MIQGEREQVSSDQHTVAFSTDIGRRHSENQDSGGAWTFRTDGGPAVSLAIVADGVSAGPRSGEASRAVVDAVRRAIELAVDGGQGTAGELVEIARAAALDAQESVPDGTTLVAAIAVGGRGAGLWCGDSRAYLVTEEGVHRLTRDHSFVQEAVDGGLVTEEQARRDSRAHMITRWLGPPAGRDVGIETFRFSLAADSLVVCCSDGLYGYFATPYGDEEEIRDVAGRRDVPLQDRLKALVGMALERGGNDNISVAAIAWDRRVPAAAFRPSVLRWPR